MNLITFRCISEFIPTNVLTLARNAINNSKVRRIWINTCDRYMYAKSRTTIPMKQRHRRVQKMRRLNRGTQAISSILAIIAAGDSVWNALWPHIELFTLLKDHTLATCAIDRKYRTKFSSQHSKFFLILQNFHFYRFKRMKLLRAHMRIHTQYPQIECGICSKRFRRNIERDNHIKERHGVPAPKKVKKPPAPPKPKIRKWIFSKNKRLHFS